MNPNVNTLIQKAVVDAMQAEALMSPEAQALAIMGKLHLALNEVGVDGLINVLCGYADRTVDELAEQIVHRFIGGGRNRLRAWEALGYETRYYQRGNSYLMSGEAVVETVHVP